MIPILQIVFVLVIIGFVLWMLTTYIPMAPPIKTIITVVVVMLVCIWLLSLAGASDIRIFRIR